MFMGSYKFSKIINYDKIIEYLLKNKKSSVSNTAFLLHEIFLLILIFYFVGLKTKRK